MLTDYRVCHFLHSLHPYSLLQKRQGHRQQQDTLAMNLASDNYSSGNSLSLEALDKKLSAKKPSRRPARAAKVDAARKMETASKLDNVSDSVLFDEDTDTKRSTSTKKAGKKKKKKGDTSDPDDEYVEVPPPAREEDEGSTQWRRSSGTRNGTQGH